jgi:ubiquinone/menaquinone biosynthesis C-methylase UbiE
MRSLSPSTVLEIGHGTGIVRDTLRLDGYVVTTLDIDPELGPDIIASVTSIPCSSKSFDAVLAAEILEHIRWEDVPRALSELARVSRKGVVIGLPYKGKAFYFSINLPKIPYIRWGFKIPSFKSHTFDGQHYWELGTREVSVRKFVELARQCGLKLKEQRWSFDDRRHVYFVFSV